MQANAPRPLRVASYNIRAGLGTDLRRDPDRVLRAVAGLGADIVALQEADHRLGARPSALPKARIAAETGLEPLDLSDHHAGLGWHGIALLVRPEIDIGEVHRFHLPGLEPRGAVAVEAGWRGARLRVAVVHLGLLRRSRRAQVAYLCDALADLEPRPTVILGDFNEWSRRKGLGRLARDFTLLTPGRTFPARRPVLALDRIAHSPDLGVRVVPPPVAGHPHPSDHRPILAELHPHEVPGA